MISFYLDAKPYKLTHRVVVEPWSERRKEEH